MGEELVPHWLNRRWFEDRGVAFRAFRGASRSQEVLREDLYRTLTASSLPALLQYEDRNSMSHSIESRVPFLTPAMASFMFSLPEHYLINDAGTTKAILRRAMRGIVPDIILDRKDKIAFNTPEKLWLSSASRWIESILDGEMARLIPVFSLPALKEEWHGVKTGERQFSFRVWHWLNLIRWSQQFQVTYA